MMGYFSGSYIVASTFFDRLLSICYFSYDFGPINMHDREELHSQGLFLCSRVSSVLFQFPHARPTSNRSGFLCSLSKVCPDFYRIRLLDFAAQRGAVFSLTYAHSCLRMRFVSESSNTDTRMNGFIFLILGHSVLSDLMSVVSTVFFIQADAMASLSSYVLQYILLFLLEC